MGGRGALQENGGEPTNMVDKAVADNETNPLLHVEWSARLNAYPSLLVHHLNNLGYKRL